MSEPTHDDLSKLWDAAFECERSGSSRETLHQLYEARMKKFTWVGIVENDFRIALDLYLEHRGYTRESITQEPSK